MHKIFLQRLLRNIFPVLLCAVFLAGCDNSVRKRPFGVFRAGKASELMAGRQYLQKQNLLIRYDNGGFAAMSTACSYDGSVLTLQDTPSGRRFVSRYSESQYDEEGNVTHGPATAPLPYYNLALKAGQIEKPDELDTIFVYVGVEKPRNWRLKYP